MSNSESDRWATPRGKLHVLLTESFPTRKTKEHGVLDVAWLASRLGMTEEGVYKWIRADRLPTKRAREIVALRSCKTDFEDFIPFID